LAGVERKALARLLVSGVSFTAAVSPAALMGALALVTVAYLVLVYVVKRWFFKHYQLD